MKTRIIIFTLVIVTILTLSACTSKKSIVGEYEGTAGSYLYLNKNGTCFYGEDDDTGASRGTWYVEDDVLYLDIDMFDYDIYASVEDMGDGFLLEADVSRWNDEYFSKIDK